MTQAIGMVLLRSALAFCAGLIVGFDGIQGWKAELHGGIVLCLLTFLYHFGQGVFIIPIRRMCETRKLLSKPNDWCAYVPGIGRIAANPGPAMHEKRLTELTGLKDYEIIDGWLVPLVSSASKTRCVTAWIVFPDLALPDYLSLIADSDDGSITVSMPLRVSRHNPNQIQQFATLDVSSLPPQLSKGIRLLLSSQFMSTTRTVVEGSWQAEGFSLQIFLFGLPNCYSSVTSAGLIPRAARLFS